MKIKFYIFIFMLLINFPVNAENNCILPTGLNVQALLSRLYICENGQLINEYKISLGRRGIGKTSAGDSKTPIGLYTLGIPRKSNRFGIFIPIQYPTVQQSAAGYTGQDVGIHGPFWLFSWADSRNTWFNWTKGCIALGNNSQITSIANWILRHPETKILISLSNKAKK